MSFHFSFLFFFFFLFLSHLAQNGKAELAGAGPKALVGWIDSSEEHTRDVLDTDLVKAGAKRIAAPCLVDSGGVRARGGCIGPGAGAGEAMAVEGGACVAGAGKVDVGLAEKKTFVVGVVAALVEAGVVPGDIQLIKKASVKAQEEAKR